MTMLEGKIYYEQTLVGDVPCRSLYGEKDGVFIIFLFRNGRLRNVEKYMVV